MSKQINWDEFCEILAETNVWWVDQEAYTTLELNLSEEDPAMIVEWFTEDGLVRYLIRPNTAPTRPIVKNDGTIEVWGWEQTEDGEDTEGAPVSLSLTPMVETTAWKLRAEIYAQKDQPA